jgi:hypothetical protein
MSDSDYRTGSPAAHIVDGKIVVLIDAPLAGADAPTFRYVLRDTPVGLRIVAMNLDLDWSTDTGP